MGKLLRVLVILLFILSIASLVLGIMLFLKRELLKGRVQKLENTLMALDAFLEEEPGRYEEEPRYPSRDISDCTPEILPNPERSDFWATYKHDLEITEPVSMLNSSGRKLELMTYYKKDPVTGRILRDPTTGFKITEGEGTMEAVLRALRETSEHQYNRLNETREELVKTREELVRTIEELNQRKAFLRERLKEIVELKAEIARLQERIRQLEAKIEQLEEEKRQLEDQIADLKRQIEMLEEKIKDQELLIKQLKDRIAELEGKEKPGEVRRLDHVEAGIKGKVSAVNPKWQFVVLNLSESFIQDLLGKDMSGRLPDVELLIKRPGKRGRPDTFVTKVKLRQVRASQRIGVGDILTNWQQMPIREGDIVFY